MARACTAAPSKRPGAVSDGGRRPRHVIRTRGPVQWTRAEARAVASSMSVSASLCPVLWRRVMTLLVPRTRRTVLGSVTAGIYHFVLWENEEKARAREQDPEPQTDLEGVRTLMAEIFAGPTRVRRLRSHRGRRLLTRRPAAGTLPAGTPCPCDRVTLRPAA